jgi:hypothetical protein
VTGELGTCTRVRKGFIHEAKLDPIYLEGKSRRREEQFLGSGVLSNHLEIQPVRSVWALVYLPISKSCVRLVEKLVEGRWCEGFRSTIGAERPHPPILIYSPTL